MKKQGSLGNLLTGAKTGGAAGPKVTDKQVAKQGARVKTVDRADSSTKGLKGNNWKHAPHLKQAKGC